jgi:uncharacterized protein
MTDAPSDPRAPHSAPARVPVPAGRATMPAGKGLVAMLVALLVWGLLYAPSLERSSNAQPLGKRRTVSLWVLKPLASISNAIQLTRITDVVSNALGKDPNQAPGGVVVPPPDVLPSSGPTGSPTPDKPPAKTTKMRTPTLTNELRVAVVGDSLAAGLGVYMERVLRPTLTRVTKQGRISTGLARQDYFDWPAALKQIMASYHPDLVVVMTGVNDNQSLLTADGRIQAKIGTFQWPKAYEQRVRSFAKIAVNGGAHVVWVGLPTVSQQERWDHFRTQNEIFAQVAKGEPNMVYVDTWNRFAAPDGGYTPFYHHDGKVELIRETDGIHFNGAGYQLVAQAAAQAAVDRFHLTPKVLTSGG